MTTCPIHPISVHFWKGTRPVGGVIVLLFKVWWSVASNSWAHHQWTPCSPVTSMPDTSLPQEPWLNELIDQGCQTVMLNTLWWLVLILNLKLLRNLGFSNYAARVAKLPPVSLKEEHVVIQHSWIILDPLAMGFGGVSFDPVSSPSKSIKSQTNCAASTAKWALAVPSWKMTFFLGRKGGRKRPLDLALKDLEVSWFDAGNLQLPKSWGSCLTFLQHHP